jgi:hypothetical protein
MDMSPLDCMRDAQQTFAERAAVYGDNYLRFGRVMAAMFPHGINITTVEDWNRIGIFVQQVSKLTRYSNDFSKGHIDSQHDLGVYSFMLESLDRIAEGQRSDNGPSADELEDKRK